MVQSGVAETGSPSSVADKKRCSLLKGLSREGTDMAGKAYAVTRSDAEWRRILTPEQYDIMRSHGTEAPRSCALLLEKRSGGFSCVGCGQSRFESKGKFESGMGWASFNDPMGGAGGT